MTQAEKHQNAARCLYCQADKGRDSVGTQMGCAYWWAHAVQKSGQETV